MTKKRQGNRNLKGEMEKERLYSIKRKGILNNKMNLVECKFRQSTKIKITHVDEINR